MTLKECDDLEQREAAEVVTKPRKKKWKVKLKFSLEQAMNAKRLSFTKKKLG